MQPELTFVLHKPRGFIDVPAEMVPHNRVIAFGVAGDCLTGDGILDGDNILVDPLAEVEDGDIAVVVARFGETTSGVVKHVHRDGDNLRLVASSKKYEDIILTPDRDPVIVGKVIGIIRTTN
jgi:SOS-response transcriptional repressor LexA